MRSGGCPAGSEPSTAARPVRPTVGFRGDRRRRRRAGAAYRIIQRAVGDAAFGRRHAHGVQHADFRLCRRCHQAQPRRSRRDTDSRRLFSNTKIPDWRCRCLNPARPTKLLPNGAAGARCLACRSLSPMMRAAGAKPSRVWACADRSREAAPPPSQRTGAPPAVNPVAPQGRQAARPVQRFIATSAKSSPATSLVRLSALAQLQQAALS